MRLIGEYFPETIFFYHSYWYDFKQIKGHTVLVIDFYKYGGSEKNRGGSEKNRGGSEKNRGGSEKNRIKFPPRILSFQ